MDFDALLLSRLQFAFVIAFHFLLPAFTIGLASYIAVLEGLHLVDATSRSTCASRASGSRSSPCRSAWAWSRGIVMPFQFGTNWSRYSDITANIVAPLMALRRADGVLPRSRLPRRPAVRPQARAAMGALLRRAHGGGRHALLDVLDPRRSTAGCRRRPASRSSTAASSRPTGSRSCSTRRFRTASRTR